MINNHIILEFLVEEILSLAERDGCRLELAVSHILQKYGYDEATQLIEEIKMRGFNDKGFKRNTH
jgi:hypothetical protein